MNAKNLSIHALVALSFLLAFKLAIAALPDSLDYQGHLTNSNGVPVDGTVNMTFRFYDVESGGLALWTDTLPVSLHQGVFSVELGGAGNPFPVWLFEQPLWLGLEVEADGEMMPRRPLTSTGFAFKAQDANTLEGSTASALDQSAHVGDSGNPHGVTAAQSGAATQADLITHTINPAAHHMRYTDTEAVVALQSHDGSGVDADRLDGQEAAAFAPAAHDHDTAYYTRAEVDSLLAAQNTRIAALEAKLAYLTVSTATLNGLPGPHVIIEGANLHVRDGSGDTPGAVNGRGNLVVGYNEPRPTGSNKSGSHNLVVGVEHNYTSYGGLVAGDRNTVSNEYASVSGGYNNTASGQWSSVSGGWDNIASGHDASVSGGRSNTASGDRSSVSGGYNNVASGAYSTVIGWSGVAAPTDYSLYPYPCGGLGGGFCR